MSIPKTDPQVLRELAEGAKGLLTDRAFIEAIKALRQQWFGELLSDEIDDSKVQNLRAKLQALEAIPRALDSMMAAPQFAQRGMDVRRTAG